MVWVANCQNRPILAQAIASKIQPPKNAPSKKKDVGFASACVVTLGLWPGVIRACFSHTGMGSISV